MTKTNCFLFVRTRNFLFFVHALTNVNATSGVSPLAKNKIYIFFPDAAFYFCCFPTVSLTHVCDVLIFRFTLTTSLRPQAWILKPSNMRQFATYSATPAHVNQFAMIHLLFAWGEKNDIFLEELIDGS